MKNPKFSAIPALAGGVILGAMLAAGPSIAQDSLQAQSPEPIYGSQLMTSQERNEYRSQMRNAQDAEARERIRREHHERMQARARERNLSLPEEPPAQGRGMGPRDDMGRGVGPGGMEQGRGMGPADGRQNRREPMGQGRGMGDGAGRGGGQR